MSCHQTEKNILKRGLWGLALGCALCTPLVSIGDEISAYPIAGLKPDQRPEDAPIVYLEIQKDDGWYQNALSGIVQPYPQSLAFLEKQGNWYTPFTRPGMAGRYDIRGWHDKKTVGGD